MSSSREERLAKNEILFREVNEHIVELSDKWGGSFDVICECANTECTSPLPVTLHEYETGRQNPHYFFVLPGHEIPDIEDVVERNDRFLVVKKHEETQEQVERADPRQPD